MRDLLIEGFEAGFLEGFKYCCGRDTGRYYDDDLQKALGVWLQEIAPEADVDTSNPYTDPNSIFIYQGKEIGTGRTIAEALEHYTKKEQS